MPRLSKRQSKALASFGFGIAKAEGCGSNAVAKKLSFAGNPAAAVAFAGRALPVAWGRCPNEKWAMALAELIIETLGSVRDAINALVVDRKAIAVADMGNPQRAQTDRGDRARGDVLVMEDGEVAPFDDLADAPGMSWRRRARAFKKSGLIECWSARFALFRMGLDLFRLCMEWGRGVSRSPPFPADLARTAKSAVQSAERVSARAMRAGRPRSRADCRDRPANSITRGAMLWIPAFAGMTG